ncbi:MAG TPA: hypothetical protein VFO07_10390 [Roseiflexaceae bacterium]|nr:hypothetical protein [Roseiflexaceae bacterium]
MNDTERRRQIIAESQNLEGRSHAIMNHSRELIAEAQRIRTRNEELIDRALTLWPDRAPPLAAWRSNKK